RPGAVADGTQHYQFAYVASQHDTNAKTFSFPMYADGTKTIPARPSADGLQDALDLIAALASSPETARSLEQSCIASSCRNLAASRRISSIGWRRFFSRVVAT